MSVLDELEAVLKQRLEGVTPGISYSAELLREPERIQRKIMEEAFEVCLEIARGERARDAGRIASEAADLLFHLLVGLVATGVSIGDVLAELERRRT